MLRFMNLEFNSVRKPLGSLVLYKTETINEF